MFFMKENAALAEPVVEGSAALGVVETGLGHPESQEIREVAAVRDLRPDVVVAEPILQLEL